MKRRQFSRLFGAEMLAAPAVRAQAQTAGVALVIGNSKYQWEAQLPNVRRDAPDIARSFQSMGLKTELLQDVGREAMSAAIARFGSASAGANLAALYFAGHGASWANDTYLVPIDADSSPSTVQSLVPVPSIESAMQGASHRLLVFDNCRNNPADGSRQLAAERTASFNQDKQRAAATDTSPNSLTLFSTAPGRVALDGPPGENSPFAAALLRQFGGPTVDLQTVAPKVRREVLVATEGRQVVWDNNTFSQPFALSGAAKPISRTSAPAGWSGDPSRIIELPNAYAFVRKNGLPLPEGIVAYRPAGNSSTSQKTGSFEFVNQTPVGPAPSF